MSGNVHEQHSLAQLNAVLHVGTLAVPFNPTLKTTVLCVKVVDYGLLKGEVAGITWFVNTKYFL